MYISFVKIFVQLSHLQRFSVLTNKMTKVILLPNPLRPYILIPAILAGLNIM